MKKLIILFAMAVALLAIEQSFLEPSEAFKPSFQKSADKILINLKLGKNIYVYDDKLKVLITRPKNLELTKELNIAKPVDFHGFAVHFDKVSIEVPFSLLKSKTSSNDITIHLQYQGCSKQGLCYQPMEEDYEFSLVKSSVKKDEKQKASSKTETDTIAQTLKEGNVFLILVTFFGFGLLLALTPCIFPMIPILSSIIVSHSHHGKEMSASKGLMLSLVYVLSMSVAYTFAGVLAGLFGANLQTALQNPFVLVSFAAIFVALAFSMFGYYKIELPKSLQTKLHKTTEGKGKQGLAGIAIMGFLSALIVGPCVAPPLAGALVYIGQTGDALLGGISLFVMSLGMGVPLLLVGAGAGRFMPRPGGWMDAVSKVFGVVMLGVAIWMLERIIPAMATMLLFAILFIGSAVYLFRLKLRGNLNKVISSLLFIYGISLFVGGINGATNPLSPFSWQTSLNQLQFKKVKNTAQLDNIIKKSNKPVMLDFYADWCISCKELEHTTFKDDRVQKKLSNFILLKADVTQNSDDDKALLKRFNLFGPPGIIFWNKDGKEITNARLVGYKSPEEFLDHLNSNF